MIVFTADLRSVVWWTGFKGPVGLVHAVKGNNNNIHSSFLPKLASHTGLKVSL